MEDIVETIVEDDKSTPGYLRPELSEAPPQPTPEPELTANPAPKGYYHDQMWASLPRGQEALDGGAVVLPPSISFPLNGSDFAYRQDGRLWSESDDGAIYDPMITLKSLSTAQQANVYRGAASAPEMAAFAAIKASIWMVDGQVLTAAQRDHFWECMGQGLQALVSQIYSEELGSPSETAVKKARAGLRRSCARAV